MSGTVVDELARTDHRRVAIDRARADRAGIVISLRLSANEEGSNPKDIQRIVVANFNFMD